MAGPGTNLALDEDVDTHRRAPAVGTQRRDVRHHTGLVVGGTAAVEASIALDRLERRGLPVGGVTGRLWPSMIVLRAGVEPELVRDGWLEVKLWARFQPGLE